MTPKTLMVDPSLCTGCNRCTYACSAKKESMFAPALARLAINTYPLQGYSVPSICFHCKRPDCLSACPERAIFRGYDDMILIDAHRCTGCGDCVPACPWGMIEVHPTNGRAYKCDLCGGDPVCVNECAYGALTFVEADAELTKARAMQMKHRSDADGPEMKRDEFGRTLLNEAGR